MIDALVDRITFLPEHDQIAALPFTAGLAPEPSQPKTGKMPKADAIVTMYTTAEAEACADVLTPGVHRTDWSKYTENWPEYEKQLTGESPAHEEGCMAHYYLTKIGTLSVVVVKSELHLATDAKTLPVKQLWQQMVGEVKPKLIITTGTAGGVGLNTVLGDTLITNSAKFNCTEKFKTEKWAQQKFVSNKIPAIDTNTWAELTAINAKQLAPVATRNPVLILGADVETVDYFAFADATDSYHVVKDDPTARVEEMDDAVLPLALAEVGLHTPWLSIRNASDPQVPHMSTLEEEKKWAAEIYNKYGYWTTIVSGITTWSVLASDQLQLTW